MKIAVVTNDGKTISQHFGRSRYFKIITIENDKIVFDELRERGTGHFAKGNNESSSGHLNPQGRHGYGSDADRKHSLMAQEIGDCDVLIAGGMGQGAYESFKRFGLDVYLTDIEIIEDAVDNFMNGTLENLYKTRTD